MDPIILKHPIKAHDQEVTVIQLSRPAVKHLKVMDDAKGDISKTAALISELSGLPPSSVDQIDAEDFAVIAEIMGGFFVAPPATGEK